MNLNGAQLHLMINHFPVVGFPIVGLALIWGLLKKKNEIFIFGIYLSILIWASTLVSYLTGEGAEDSLRQVEGFQIDFVHVHEDTALVAMILSSVLVFVGLGCLPFIQHQVSWLQKPSVEKKIRWVLVIGFFSLSFILAIAGHQGGVIRHSEIR